MTPSEMKPTCDRCGKKFPYGITFKISIISRLTTYRQKDYILCPACLDLIESKIEEKDISVYYSNEVNNDTFRN